MPFILTPALLMTTRGLSTGVVAHKFGWIIGGVDPSVTGAFQPASV